MRQQSKRLAQHRLAKLSGQIRGIHRMVEQGATCLDVLTQISAARAALDQFGVVVLSEHLEGCIVEASIDRSPSMESRLEEMRKSLDQFLPLFSTALPGRWREPTETATDLAEISPTQ